MGKNAFKLDETLLAFAGLMGALVDHARSCFMDLLLLPFAPQVVLLRSRSRTATLALHLGPRERCRLQGRLGID